MYKNTEEMMGKTTLNVVIRNNTLERLKLIMHPGQTYDGVITEILDLKGQLSPETLARLEEYRTHPRETVDDLIKVVLDELESKINKLMEK